MNDYERLKLDYTSQLQFFEQHKFLNRGRIKLLKAKIQAIEEGQHNDVLVPSVTGVSNVSENIDKNNYGSYAKQVRDINEMYNNRTDYAGEFLKSIVDTLVAFIVGEGINLKSNYESTIKWINNEFLDPNKLRGSKLLDSVTIGEMEGKCLFTIYPEKDKENESKGKILVRRYSYYKAPYTIETEENNDEKIKRAIYQKDEASTAQTIANEPRLVYIKLGGSPDRFNNTPPRIANILTDIENASRCKYDMRKNNHLFGRVTPYFKTATSTEAKSLTNRIVSLMWRIGRTFVGTADFSLVEPSGRAIESLIKELVIYMKHISLNTGIPLQWLAYPELLSNRATADNMIETINASTIKYRTIWEEGLTELIRKSMILAFEKGWIKSNAFKPNDFQVEIPQVSIALLTRLMEVWLPLAEAGYLSKQTTMGMIPGIDPTKEKELIEGEKEENMQRFNNNMLGKNAIGNAIEQNNKQDESKEEEKQQLQSEE